MEISDQDGLGRRERHPGGLQKDKTLLNDLVMWSYKPIFCHGELDKNGFIPI